jgi:hypothetical protein
VPARASTIGGVGPAVRFVARAWREAWAALILAGATTGAFLDAAGWGAGPVWKAAWLALALLAITVARGALYRSALDSPGAGLSGLQWGRVETRLLAVWLLGAVFLFILALLVFVALLCCAYAVASAGAGFVPADPATWAPAVDVRGRWVLGAVGIAGAAGLLWAQLRLCLASAATVARGRVQVLSAWPTTRGSAWAILVPIVLVSLTPAALLAALIILGGRLAGGSFLIVGVLNFAEGLAVAGLWLPMNVGLMAYLHRRADSAAT